MIYRFLGIIFWLVLPTSVFSQNLPKPPESGDAMPTIEVDPVVVTATRTATPLQRVGSSVTVITAEELKQQGHVMVADALRSVAGVDIVRSGGLGRTTSIFIRGANSGHSLILMDGVALNDPVSAGNTADLAHLTLEQVERIEIVRGPHSTVYGSDALGGVVQIVTKKGGDSMQPKFELESGSFGTYRGLFEVKGGEGGLHYALSGSHLKQDGISAANEKLGNTEKDGYRNTSFNGSLSYEAGRNVVIGLTGRTEQTKGDIDNRAGRGGDDPNYESEADRLFLKSFAEISMLEGRWIQTLGVSFSQHDRDLLNDTDEDHPLDSSRSRFDGERLEFQWQHDLQLGPDHRVALGLVGEEERGESFFQSTSAFGGFTSVFDPQEADTTGLFLQDQWALRSDLDLTLGLRWDDHDRFGSETTYRGAFSYQLNPKGTSLRGSFGTGFKAPTLFQLYSSFGSRDLLPESSEGWDIGLAREFSGTGARIALTYFNNQFDQLIDFDNTLFVYGNIAVAETEGFEVEGSWRPDNRWYLSGSFTYLDSLDGSTGSRLLRRPDEKLNLVFGYQWPNQWDVNLQYRYVGGRDFNDFSTSPSTLVTLGGHSLWNTAARWQVSRKFELFARVENLLDRDYEEVLGFGTQGLSGYLGLRLIP